jgi:hypothetical protein
MVLLAAATLLVIVGAIALLEQALPAAGKKPAYLADQTAVRVVGAPFVPNTNPRER